MLTSAEIDKYIKEIEKEKEAEADKKKKKWTNVMSTEYSSICKLHLVVLTVFCY